MGSYRSRSIYQLHIQLEEIEPAIWRRISVPGKISLARLHRLLQLAMGWENYHLRLFTIGEVLYGEPDPEYADEGIHIKHDRHASVRDVLRTEGMRFRYDYDFGDDWCHDVLVERIELLNAEDWVAPRCLDGRRACPPEDCGGVSGYDELLEALRDPHHDDHERLRTWVGLTLIPNSSPCRSLIRPLPWSRHAFPFRNTSRACHRQDVLRFLKLAQRMRRRFSFDFFLPGFSRRGN